MGTMEMDSEERVVVVYSAPIALVAFDPEVTLRPFAVASVARIVVI